VTTCLERLGLSADGPTVESLAAYGTELLLWSRRIDLCGARSAEDFASGPLFDALTLVPLLEARGTLLDVGSGGGLPGVPAQLFRPELALTLLEPRTRRAAFLRHICAKLGLPCTIREGRLEEQPGLSFDSAVAQAVWPPREWMEKAATVVRAGGAVYVLSAAPLTRDMLPQGATVEQELRFEGRSLERWAARVRLAG
jgi:16S rRNA (guanine527-N7)-methyltransferase